MNPDKHLKAGNRIQLRPEEVFIGASIVHDEGDYFNAVIKSINGNHLVINDFYTWSDLPSRKDCIYPAHIRDFLLERMGFESRDNFKGQEFYMRTSKGGISLTRVYGGGGFENDAYELVINGQPKTIHFMTDLQLTAKEMLGVDLRVVEKPEAHEGDSDEDEDY